MADVRWIISLTVFCLFGSTQTLASQLDRSTPARFNALAPYALSNTESYSVAQQFLVFYGSISSVTHAGTCFSSFEWFNSPNCNNVKVKCKKEQMKM